MNLPAKTGLSLLWPANWPDDESVSAGLRTAGYDRAPDFESRLDTMGTYLSTLLPQGDRRSESFAKALEKGRANCMTRMVAFALLSAQLGVKFLPNIVAHRSENSQRIVPFHADGYAVHDTEALYIDSIPGTIGSYRRVEPQPDGPAEEFILSRRELLLKNAVVQINTDFNGRERFRLGEETAEPFDDEVATVRTIFVGEAGLPSFMATVEYLNGHLDKSDTPAFIPRMH